MARFETAVVSAPDFSASCVTARFWSSMVIANQRSAGTDGALFMAIRQLVLQGLPTTRTRTPGAACLAMAWPWPVKIFPLIPSRSFRSIPALRGTDPTRSAQSTPLNPSSRDEVGTIPLRSGKAQSWSSMTTPPSAGRAGSTSTRWRMTGWSAPNIEPDAMRKRRE